MARVRLHEIPVAELGTELAIRVYEVNKLMKLAKEHGLQVSTDMVERIGQTEFIVRVTRPT